MESERAVKRFVWIRVDRGVMNVRRCVGCIKDRSISAVMREKVELQNENENKSSLNRGL